jgi:hypothetical protein
MVMGVSSRCTQLLGSRGRLAVTQDQRWVLLPSTTPLAITTMVVMVVVTLPFTTDPTGSN